MSYADVVLADNPIHYWRLEETAGTAVVNSAGNIDLVNVGANLDVDGVDGSGAEFDGVDDYIDSPSDNIIHIPSVFSVEMWMLRPSSPSANDVIWSNYFGSAFPPFGGQLEFSGSLGRLRFTYGNDTDSSGPGIMGDSSVTQTTAGVWHHIVVSSDGSFTRMHLDGAEVATDSKGYTANSQDAHRFQLAARRDGFEAALGGFANIILDEVAVYDYALTGAQIESHYNELMETPVTVPPPVPQNVAAVRNEGDNIVSWDAVPDVTEYTIERQVVIGGDWVFDDLITVGDVTSYNDTQPVGSYRYRVRSRVVV